MDPDESERDIFRQISQQAYSPEPLQQVGGYDLITSTPTLKAYKQGEHVIVGVRGTEVTDINDLYADALIATNQLSESDRAKADFDVVEKLRAQHPTAKFEGAGHSLGGALIDAMIDRGLLLSGVSYNPAVQLAKQSSKNTRVYNEDDPLYRSGRPFLQRAPIVKPAEMTMLRVAGYFNPLYSAYNALQAHRLQNVKGSGRLRYSCR
jgi:hypothetical protein